MMVGLELIFELIKNQFKSKADLVITVFHTFLLNNQYRLIGLGNVEEANDSRNGTELLPIGWNDLQDAYVFRYRRTIGNEVRTLMVKAIRAENLLLINIIENPGELTGSIEVAVDTYINDNYTLFNGAFTSSAYLKQLEEKFKKEILDKITFSNSSTRNPAQQAPPVTDPLRIGPPRYPSVPRMGGNDLDPFGNPIFPRIGGSDLHPLARPGAGGMLMDPRDFQDVHFPSPRDPNSDVRYPSLPPGSVPPGARFDPIRPRMPGDRPNRPRSGEPDPDHFRPPGYDDMFM